MLKRAGRVLRNILTGSEASRHYPARAREMLPARVPGIGSLRLQALPDRLIEIFWRALPPRVRAWKSTQALGRRIHQRVCRVRPRGGGCFTRFFRNLPQLELVRDLVLEMPPGGPVKIASLGCSTGAELYSLLWLIRSARPMLEIRAIGIDSAEECVHAAARGVYPFRVVEVAAISETSHDRLFTRKDKTLVIEDWIRDPTTWIVGDACSPHLAADLGHHDVVLANNFVFHMAPEPAEACLRNLAGLVAPNGVLVVSGVDLDLRSRVLRELGFVPVTERCEEVHAAEDVHSAWPLHFWGLEPIDRSRPNWPERYATVFRAPGGIPAAT